VCITANQPDTESDLNPNPDPHPTTKQHAKVNIQRNSRMHVIVTLPAAFSCLII